MANKPKVVRISSVPDKWVALLTWIQSGTAHVHRCVFPTELDARRAQARMIAACDRNTYLHLGILRKHTDIYMLSNRS